MNATNTLSEHQLHPINEAAQYNFQTFEVARRRVPSECRIPMFPAKARAGYGENGQTREFIQRLDSVKLPGFDNLDYTVFWVHGNSLLPYMKEEEFLVATRQKMERDFPQAALAVVKNGTETVVRRVHFADDVVLLDSDNPEVESEWVASEDISEIWQVRARISKLPKGMEASGNERISAMEYELEYLRQEIWDLKKRLDSRE